MRVIGGNTSTYLLVNGIATSAPVRLGPGLDLLPVDKPPSPDLVFKNLERDFDTYVLGVFVPWVACQLRVSGQGRKDVAARAWNALWDVLLLGAVHNAPVACVLQSSADLRRFKSTSRISVIDYSFQGHQRATGTYDLTEQDVAWLEAHFSDAQLLLHDHKFQTAIHCLASYRWHSMPRARMALIWAGIESLFGVDSEIVFRVSLYVAKFLAPNDPLEQKVLFDLTKRLYKSRSMAVHGGKMKGDPKVDVVDSAALLRRLVIRCTELAELPKPENLAL